MSSLSKPVSRVSQNKTKARREYPFVITPSDRLLGLGNANLVLAQVVDGVPRPKEGIAQNTSQVSRQLHAHECRDAGTAGLDGVVIGADGEVVASKTECDIRQRVASVALKSVGSTVTLLRANLLVEHLRKVGLESDQRGAGIEDDARVVKGSSLAIDGDAIKVDLPVSLAADGNVDDLASVVVLIRATKDNLGSIAILAEVKGEDGLVDQLLVNHVVERRHDLVDRDRVIAHAQNAIEFAEGKGQTRLLGSLGEVLVLDGEVTNLQGVLGDETLHGPGTVLNLERGTVLLVGRGRRRLVLGVQIACYRAALRRWHPKVRAAGVEDNLESLGGSSDADLREVLRQKSVSDPPR